MKQKSIKLNARLLTCLVVLALVFATFIAGTSTSNAAEDVFGNIELKVGDTLGFVYYTEQPYTTNTTMRFTVNGRTSTSVAYPNDGKCVFIFNDIYPHELAKEVTATIVVNGKDTVTSTGLSIKEYLLQMLLNPNSTAAEKQFASDTLQYGEQTRLYRNMNVEPSERDDVSITEDINTSIYTAYKPQSIEGRLDGTASGLGVSASNIRMSSIGISYHNINRYVVTLQVPTGSSINPQNIKVVIGDKEYTVSNFIDKGNGKWEVHSDAINAYDIMENANTPKTTQFKLYVNGKIVQQASYNVMDYIYQLQDTTASNHLALYYARSLYRYGQSAKAAYKGNRIVSIALKQNPGDEGTPGIMVPRSTSAQTPLRGAITAYYADGTSKTIDSGITWKNKDTSGNDIKITDDTHEKTFTVQGSYTDSVSGKTYTVTGQIKLHNDMTGIERYTDPTTYAPTSYTSSYTPTGSVVRCTWANGYQANRTPTHSAITMTDYATDEYGFIPTTASYTDPKSGIAKTVKMYLYYQNPIKSITITNSTATFDGGTSAAPVATTYTVTFTNTKTLSKNTSSATWTTTIQNGDNTATKTYTYSHTNVTYEGVAITASLSSTGTLSCPAHGNWTAKSAGQNSSVGASARDVTDAFTVSASNPEKSFTFSVSPSIVGGTVLSTSAPSGSKGSTTAGQLSGGTTYITYGNGKTETVSATYTSNAGITDTAYSKSITVTASYTGKGGGSWTATRATTVYNKLKSVSQKEVKKIASASTVNTQLTLATTANTLTATYHNGKTATVGDGTSATTNIYLNGTLRNTACYVESIATNTVTNADRTTAGASNSTTSRYGIRIVFTDTRTGSDGATATLDNYKVNVYNTYVSISTTSTSAVYMTGANATPKPTDAVTVVLSNGKTLSHSNPTYGQPASITDTTEYADRSISVSATATDGTTVSRTVTCRVINKPTSAAVKTQPASKTVSTQTQFPASSVTGGVLTVTFANGQKADKSCTSYATTSSTKLTGTTATGTFDITGYYAGTYATVSATMRLTLNNTPKSATFSPNSITLSSSGQKPTGTLNVTYDNGYVEAHTGVTSSTTIYSSGTTSNSGATTTYNGSVTVSATKTVAGESMTGSGTCSWTNPLKSLADAGTAYRDCATSGNTITMSNSYVNGEAATATYSSGATKSVTPTLAGGEVSNVSGTAYYHTRTVSGSYTENNVTVSCTITVSIRNPVYTVTVADKTKAFAGYTSKNTTAKVESITATIKYKNGASKSGTVTPSITVKSGSVGTNTAGSGWVQCVYTGTSEVYWDVTYTASYTENGRTATGDFKVSYQNTFYVYVAQDTNYNSYSPYTTSGNVMNYAFINFQSNSTTTITSKGNWAIQLRFANGKTINKGCTTDGLTIDGGSLSHTYTSCYKNGDKWSQTTGSSGTLEKFIFKYTIDGYSDDDYCLGYRYTYYSDKYATCDMKLRHSEVTSHHAQPSCWAPWCSVTRYYQNSKSTLKCSGYYSVGDNNGSYSWWFGTNSSWGNYSSNNRSSTSGTSGLSGVKGAYTGAVARTSLGGALNGTGWYSDDGYLVMRLPTSCSVNGYSCSNKDATNRYTWASSLEFMGY